MRIIGYILLIFGFVIIGLVQTSVLKTAIHTSGERIEALGTQQTFTRTEVESAVLNTAKSAAFRSRGNMVGPIAMLAGGVLLDVARRRKQKVVHAA